MERPLALGIIGCGRAATALHLPALASLADVCVAAVCDTDPTARAAAQNAAAVPNAYSDYRELIDDPRVEAIAVCTPATAHAEAAVAALSAGKPTFVEKPLALTVDDCDRMIEASAQGRALGAVGQNLRCHRLVEQARQTISRGDLGRIQLIRTVWTAGFNLGRDMPAWRHLRESGGGALIELGVHHIDLWRFLTGDEIAECRAISFSDVSEDQAVALQGRLESGAVCSTALCQRTADSNEIEVFGDRGRLRFSVYQTDSFLHYATSDLGGGMRTRLKEIRQRASQIPALLQGLRGGGPYRETYAVQWTRFAQAVRAGTEPPCSLEEGRAAIRALAGVTRTSSAESSL